MLSGVGFFEGNTYLQKKPTPVRDKHEGRAAYYPLRVSPFAFPARGGRRSPLPPSHQAFDYVKRVS
jgi:hypothetical protein